MVKFGVADYGIDVWEGGCFSLEKRLVQLKSLGYDGIEWLKGMDAADAFANAVTFHRCGMDFASCSMSVPEMTLKCACAFGKSYVWIPIKTRDVDMETYCRRSRAFCAGAAEYGVSGAIHNHLGARIESQEELEGFLQEVPAAKLLLDIGHLAGAGGDCAAVIEKYADRLAAVHFKGIEVTDPTQSLENWPKRFRLCGLREDTLGIDFPGIVNALKKVHYDGWLLIEHDTHLRDPYLDLEDNLMYLKQLWNS